jgi:hypothetical protein
VCNVFTFDAIDLRRYFEQMWQEAGAQRFQGRRTWMDAYRWFTRAWTSVLEQQKKYCASKSSA